MSNTGEMLKHNVLVRKAIGIETAGSLNILFSDKTGTITKGELEVVEFFDGNLKDTYKDDSKVKEIAKAGRFTYVPNTLPFVLGVYNLRGEIIPILDLRIFFNIDVPERDENKLENIRKSVEDKLTLLQKDNNEKLCLKYVLF